MMKLKNAVSTVKSTMCVLIVAIACGCSHTNGQRFEDVTATPEKPMAPPTKTQILCWRNYEIAQRHIAHGDWKTGLDYCRKALGSLAPDDPNHAHGAMRNNMTWPLLENGLVDEAIKMATSALQYNKKSGDAVGIACSYLNLGECYHRIGNKAKRNEYWGKGYEVALTTKDRRVIRFHKAKMDIIKKERQREK